MAEIKFAIDNKWAITHLKWEVVKRVLEAVIQIGYTIMVITFLWVIIHLINDPFDSGFKVGSFNKGLKEAQK